MSNRVVSFGLCGTINSDIDNHYQLEGDNMTKDFGPNPYVINIEEETLKNENYRTTLWTGSHLQLTVMNILPGEDIGLEMHSDVDQFLRIEEGEAFVQMGDSEDNLDFEAVAEDNFAVFIPAGKWHNLTNKSDEPLKVYSIYAPVEHPHGTVHKTHKEAMEADHDH